MRAGPPIAITDHQLLPWEKRCHALLETLNSRNVISMEEKRRGIEDMGQTIYAALSYYEKWAMCAANVLVNKGHITPDELSAKIIADPPASRLQTACVPPWHVPLPEHATCRAC